MGSVPYDGGVTFRIWAPNADQVHVTGSFNSWAMSTKPLAHERDGIWSADVPDAKPGDEYKFVIRNGDQTLLRTDPYARDVLAPRENGIVCRLSGRLSNISHHPASGYTAPAEDELIIYELHVGTFSQKADGQPGDFDGVISRLPYLKEIGVNAIELMPVMAFEGDRSWGYEPAQPFAVSRNYGGPNGLKRLVKAAHEHSIAVIVDVIYNHLGPWGLDVWQFDGWNQDDLGGIYFYNDWRAKTPWGHTRLDYGRQEVRKYIRDNVFMWLEEYEVDGLRWDATAYIRNAHGENNDHGADIPEGWFLMKTINEEMKSRFPSVISIAEDLHANPYLTKGTQFGGSGFDSQWDPCFVHPIRHALCAAKDEDRNMNAVRDALTFQYNDSAFQRLICTESHDEVANGSTRIPEEVAVTNGCGIMAKKMAALGATLLLTSPGIPMIFQGQEFLDIGRFDDLTPLDWSNMERNEGLVHLFRDLSRLRRNLEGGTSGLRGQHIDVYHINDQEKAIAYRRWNDDESGDEVVVIVNFSGRELRSYPIGLPSPGSWKVHFNGDRKEYDESFGDFGASIVEVNAISVGGSSYESVVNVGAYSGLILSQC
jgi:1,4-alpha-glucan branching enzyme